MNASGFYGRLTGLVSLVMLVAACGPSDNNAGAQGGPGGFGPVPVHVAKPMQASVTEWDAYTGRFEAVQSVDVRARVGGYLDSIHFKDGDMVEAGDLLFVIDPKPFQAVADAARANVARAKARLTFTETELKRAEPLLSRGNISQEGYDQAVQNRSQAQAELEAAQADLRRAELDLSFTQVKAPISGRLSTHFVSVGNLIAGGDAGATVLTRIVSINPIHFVFDASESDYLKYLRQDTRGQRPSSRDVMTAVQVQLSDEDSYDHQGMMNFVDNRVDPETGTMRGRAVFNNDDGFLTPGVFGRLRLKGRGPFDGLLVPDSAVVSDQSRRLVMVVGSEGKVEPRNITLGSLYRGLRVIESGLQPDDLVLLDGLMMARPGTPVQPEEETLSFPEGSEE